MSKALWPGSTRPSGSNIRVFRFSLALLAILPIAAISAGTLATIRQEPTRQDEHHSILRLIGSGTTFPYPIYQKWFRQYSKSNPGVIFNYSPIGSGGGVVQVREGTVDFGGTDALQPEDSLSKV